MARKHGKVSLAPSDSRAADWHRNANRTGANIEINAGVDMSTSMLVCPGHAHFGRPLLGAQSWQCLVKLP